MKRAQSSSKKREKKLQAPNKRLKAPNGSPLPLTPTKRIIRDNDTTVSENKGFSLIVNLLQSSSLDSLSISTLQGVGDVLRNSQAALDFFTRHTPAPLPMGLGFFCVFSQEVLLHLLSFLTAKDLINLRCVCKIFSEITRDKHLWKEICYRQFLPQTILNQLHEELDKSWEWIYHCYSVKWRSREDIPDGGIGTFESGDNIWRGQWKRHFNRPSFFSQGTSEVFLHGYGIHIDHFNNISEGNFVYGLLDGQGRELYSLDKFSYEYRGAFQKGFREGEGRCRYSDGRVYVGKWRQGKHHYEGTMTYTDGRKFSGEWADGKRNGPGELIWPSSVVYKGHWIMDEIKGDGTFVHPFGQKKSQIVNCSTVEEGLTTLFGLMNDTTKKKVVSQRKK
eukprot:TRINITY_DN7491_c0_g1_i1.p1 TRINITY_DN7491_c0_g1~~TRINITY_DN7491_c0_g1_i1.p1  ORF type:complete len:391 (-),score=61.25 TRINITY_DN7491_c0_g1_i1:24-1196(-)